MPATSETIVSATTHPGDSTAETVTGDKFKGDGYYGRFKSDVEREKRCN